MLLRALSQGRLAVAGGCKNWWKWSLADVLDTPRLAIDAPPPGAWIARDAPVVGLLAEATVLQCAFAIMCGAVVDPGRAVTFRRTPLCWRATKC